MKAQTKFRIGLIFFFFGIIAAYTQNVTKVTSSNVNLRNAADVNSDIVDVIPKGTVVMLRDDCDCTWIPVKYQDKIGYIHSKYLKSPNLNTTKAKHYTNSKGDRVQSPTHYDSTPAGATALCRDGTYSFSQSRRGTCSHHGGVARWL